MGNLFISFLLWVCGGLVGFGLASSKIKDSIAKGEIECKYEKETLICWNPNEDK